MNNIRGYFGIGIYHTKTETNVGTLWRSAHNFGASFIFTVGRRYKGQSSDTTKAWKSIPLYHFESISDLYRHIPMEARIVGIEQTSKSIPIDNFIHPKQCVYFLGAEDHGLPKDIISICQNVIHISTPMCLNVAVAGSIVMFDRMNKDKR